MTYRTPIGQRLGGAFATTFIGAVALLMTAGSLLLIGK